MFEMILLICAMRVPYDGLPDYCVGYVDRSGIYMTVEECNIRSEEVLETIKSNQEMVKYLLSILGSDGMLGLKGECKDVSASYA